MRYAVVIEKADRNYGGYVPDLPGCVATGATVQETMTKLREAIRLHIAGMIEDAEPLPDPTTLVDYLETDVIPADDFNAPMTSGTSKTTGPAVGNLKRKPASMSGHFRRRVPQR